MIALIILLMLSSNIYGLDNDMYADIAEEMYSSGLYKKSIAKCKSVLSHDSKHSRCLSIIKRSKAKLKERENLKRIAQEKNKAQEKKKKLEKRRQEEKLAKEEKERNDRWLAKINSSEYNSKKLCFCIASHNFINGKILEEKRIGIRTGYENKNQLYKFGKQIIMLEKAEDHYRVKLRNINHTFNPSICKSKENWDAFERCLNGVPGKVFI